MPKTKFGSTDERKERTKAKLVALSVDSARRAQAEDLWRQFRPMVFATIRDCCHFLQPGTELYAEAVASGEAKLWELALSFDSTRKVKPSSYFTLPLKRHFWHWCDLHNRKGFMYANDPGSDRRASPISMYSLDLEYNDGNPISERVADDYVAADVLTYAELRHFVAQLSQREQEVIRLHFWEGLPFRELAALTGNSRQNEQQILQVAVKKLRKMFTENENKNGKDKQATH